MQGPGYSFLLASRPSLLKSVCNPGKTRQALPSGRGKPLPGLYPIRWPDNALCMVIRLVHQNSVRIMINRNIYRAAGGKFYPGAGPAASGKIIYNQFV